MRKFQLQQIVARYLNRDVFAVEVMQKTALALFAKQIGLKKTNLRVEVVRKFVFVLGIGKKQSNQHDAKVIAQIQQGL